MATGKDRRTRRGEVTSALILGRAAELLREHGYAGLTLRDVVMTGTPPGVRTVAVGDTLTIEVEGLGSTTNQWLRSGETSAGVTGAVLPRLRTLTLFSPPEPWLPDTSVRGRPGEGVAVP